LMILMDPTDDRNDALIGEHDDSDELFNDTPIPDVATVLEVDEFNNAVDGLGVID
jgi:hypothetical protein